MSLLHKRVILAGIATVLCALGIAAAVHAWPGVPDRKENYGYFTNSFVREEWRGDEVFEEGLYTYNVNSFINKIKDKLNNGDRRHKTGAAFIIQTMRGELDRGRPPTGEEIADWEARVRYADQQGWVSWDVMIRSSTQSYYSSNINDDAFEYYDVLAEGIRFVNAQGAVVYQIHHRCANPVGNLSGLPPAAEYDLQPSVSASRTQVAPDDKVSFSYNMQNNGLDQSRPTTWTVREIVFSPGEGTGQALPGGDGRDCSYYTSRGAGICRQLYSGPSQRFNSGANNLSNAVPANVRTVDVDYPLGTRLCRILTVTRPTQKASPTNRWSDARCIAVAKRPTVHFLGGDISVGNPYPDQSPTCSLRPKTGNVYTVANDVNNGSTAEYAAFVRGIINFEVSAGHGFGTNSRSGINQLSVERLAFANTEDEAGKFGSNECMVDYYERLRSRAPAAINSPGTRTFSNISGKRTFHYKGNLTINASNIRKGASIIVIVNGDVNITGNIRYGGPGNQTYDSAKDIPGFAVVVNGNITVQPTVETLDGAYVSKQVVTTCAGAPVRLSTRVCNRQLQLNGVLFTDKLQLPRTFGSDGNEAREPAERFNFTTEMFFNNVLLDSNEGNIRTVNQRDLPPRY